MPPTIATELNVHSDIPNRIYYCAECRLPRATYRLHSNYKRQTMRNESHFKYLSSHYRSCSSAAFLRCHWMNKNSSNRWHCCCNRYSMPFSLILSSSHTHEHISTDNFPLNFKWKRNVPVPFAPSPIPFTGTRNGEGTWWTWCDDDDSATTRIHFGVAIHFFDCENLL